MAEQIPYGVASNLINTLASLAFKEIASIYGVESDIEWLKETVEDIKAVLTDADQKQNTDQLIQRWIAKLKKVLYEADDLLDEVHARHLLHKRDSKGKVRDFFSSSNPVAFRHKIAGKIRNIRKQFNDVYENMSKLNLVPRVGEEVKHGKSSNWRETSSKPEENIIGREENVKEVIDLLLKNNNDNENVFLVVIVGIGGLGKTALAQLVYNNAKDNRLFDKLIWVCVSEDFDVITLLKKILEASSGTDVKDRGLQWLQDKLEENLDGQRYLLVLDDVWNEDREKWLALKKYMMCGAKGSKILVTTRNQTVANKMDVKTPYVLKGLENDQSWALLKRLAFDEDQTVTQNLKVIGKKIAQKCAGVPLAIRVMGGLLRSKSKPQDWEAILKGDFWKLCEDNSSIMAILKLSYDSLPIELKQCFAYCSLYPKDWRYEKEELVDLWMAQGFLGNKDKEKCPEDVGEDYVRILLMKSFLQDVMTDKFNEIKYFKMHDLMHDLSQSIASPDYGLYAPGRKNIAKFPMHASFEKYNPVDSLNVLDPSRLRTFLEIEKNDERYPSDLLVFKRLRSLDLSSYKMSDLPESIGKMSHLRYLKLSCTKLTCLPKSIVNLVHLETLKLVGCGNLKISVDIITKLINLRKLDTVDCEAFKDGMPLGLGGMPNLQSLSCTNLVKLMISDMRNCQYLAPLEGLVSLKTLDISWMEKLECIYYKGYSSSTTFFPSLEELEIMGCESFRGWQKEGNVHDTDTSDNERHHSLPQFSRLSSLAIDGCPNLSCLPTFPNLVFDLRLSDSSTKPLVDTLKVSRSGPSTSHDDMAPSLSMLKSLKIKGIDMESLPEEWMQNLSSLQHLFIENFSSPEIPFRHMQKLPAELEELALFDLDSWCGIEDYSAQCQDLCCLRSLQKIRFSFCHRLEALPEWICDLQNLRYIKIYSCSKLVSFPEGICRLTNLQTLEVYSAAPLLKWRYEREKGAEWPKIAHIPHIRIKS